ncbi:squalene/phytoene synthase family protein [Limibaculum sp. M0105]|uniref:Squalene/phytoene synthase family protein n=1 Tax=Thermohalobaculum xanthum TaxID=2753746 RepID=A0A8J7SA19_9RHOB|nr:squalene/phytoene synthase family protein [Thermohalobaculum xanthum]MBK0397738.1 squalene/phytoene synthase family protein [Thermohalobaculum xanthum]
MTPAGLDALRPLPSDAPDPAAEVARITRAAGSSFGPGMAILPRPRREGMWALYAFSRVIDDIADEDWPIATKHELLDAWRGEIAALYAGRPVSVIGRALAGPVERYELPEAEFLLLIEGMQMDADGPVIAPPMAELRRYTRRVAGAVGMLSMRIFGAWRGDVSARFAQALGDALQLTNILRDVEEDAALGRLYLPQEMLARHGIPPRPEEAASHPALPALGAELGALARAEFDAARALVPAHDRLALAPALMMMGVYEAYLNRMAARGFAREALKLSKPSKLLAGVTCILAPAWSRRDV